MKCASLAGLLKKKRYHIDCAFFKRAIITVQDGKTNGGLRTMSLGTFGMVLGGLVGSQRSPKDAQSGLFGANLSYLGAI